MFTLAEYKQKSHLIEQLIDYLPSAIVVLDTNTSIVLANTMAEQLSKKSRQDIFSMQGGNAFGCIHAEDDPQGCGHSTACRECVIRTTVENTIQNHTNLMNVEAPMILAEAGKRILSVSTIWLEVNQLVVVALNDITDLKQQEKIRLEHTRLESAIETSGAVCHELNQPLFVISGTTELLQLDESLPQNVRDQLEVIRTQIHRMGELTRRLMHLTQFKEMHYLNETILDLQTSSSMPS